jgi:hypothetical protein
MSEKDPPEDNDDWFDAPEREESERRWADTVRELRAMADRVKDIRVKPRPDGGIRPKHVRNLYEMLYGALREDERPELKRKVARRMADKAGQYLLWNRLISTPTIHELTALLPWWVSQAPGDVVPKLREIALKNVLNGAIIPVQTVLEQVLSSRQVFLGHCVCRSAGIADDLEKDGKVFAMLSEDKKRKLLDRIVDRFEGLRGDDGRVADTADRYQSIFADLSRWRAAGDARYRLESLISSTHPDWEILPVHENYTPDWIRGMHANYKAHSIHRELVFDLATILFLTRGTIFTSMRMLDTPYTICSCPTPENGGGCVLTNWYYCGQSNRSLLANDDVHGRRRDADGEVMPCRFFPDRKQRECIGCGCNFDDPQPRGVDCVLAEADRIYDEHQRR